MPFLFPEPSFWLCHKGLWLQGDRIVPAALFYSFPKDFLNLIPIRALVRCLLNSKKTGEKRKGSVVGGRNLSTRVLQGAPM